MYSTYAFQIVYLIVLLEFYVNCVYCSYTGQKIVTRWTSQRDRYRREFKGEAEDKRSGAGASKKRRSPFFEMLDFLRNVMELRHTITNISEIEERRGIQAQRIPSKRKR